MRHLFFLLLFFLFGTYFSQSHWNFNYQAIAHDANGDTLNNKNLEVEVGVYSDTNDFPEYEEIHNVSTNRFGLFNFQIGNGNIITGSNLTDLDWSDNNVDYFLNIKILYNSIK